MLLTPADSPTSIHAADATPVVLDTNIWIDMLIFDDPRVRPIRAALQTRRLRAVISASCREELRRVLGYPQFAHFAIDHQSALADVDALTTLYVPDDAAQGETSRLPQCRDRDDQKFLELARDAGACWLVSKDKAVLKLRKRMRQAAGCEVGQPEAFCAWLTQQSA